MGIDLKPYLGKLSQDESFLLMDILNDLGKNRYTVEHFITKYTFKRIKYVLSNLYKTDLDIDVMDEINLIFEELLEKYPPNEYPEKWI